MAYLNLPLTGNGGLWVFGYGSLMWDSGFACGQISAARVYGWHRRFSLRSTMAWGSAARPGLCASLHAGGSVAGRGLFVEAGDVSEAVELLMHRERAYHPRIVYAAMNTQRVGMLSFVHDYDHPRSAAGLAPPAQARLIAQGRGSRGTSLFYLRRTLLELAKDGVRDKRGEELLALIEG